MKLSDLSPQARAQAEAIIGEQAKRRANPAKSRKGVGDGQPCPYRCDTCGVVFSSYTRWERHGRAVGHYRGSLILNQSH